MLSIYKSVTGVFVENTYFVVNKDEKWGVIIDPGQDAYFHLKQLNFNDISWKAIFITHAHTDHLLDLSKIVKKRNPKIYLHRADLFLYYKFKEEALKYGYNYDELPEPDFFWDDNDIISIGSVNFNIIHTPGHTPGSVCIKYDNKLFTGDTLMYHSIGISENYGSLKENKKSVVEKLFKLPDNTIVYPGHQKPTTIAEEKRYNFKISIQ
jgi:glyoxylase-like metal-dependent hydrolase (beta-lactamase superfamily II)